MSWAYYYRPELRLLSNSPLPFFDPVTSAVPRRWEAAQLHTHTRDTRYTYSAMQQQMMMKGGRRRRSSRRRRKRMEDLPRL